MSDQPTPAKPKTTVIGHVIVNPHNGRYELTFPHTTGTMMRGTIDEMGAWVRSKGGYLGAVTTHPVSDRRCRLAIFPKPKRLPKWAQPAKPNQ